MPVTAVDRLTVSGDSDLRAAMSSVCLIRPVRFAHLSRASGPPGTGHAVRKSFDGRTELDGFVTPRLELAGATGAVEPFRQDSIDRAAKRHDQTGEEHLLTFEDSISADTSAMVGALER
jgi:hypothetical protein